MKFINLTKGFKAMVDDSDYGWLSQWKWHYDGRYATRTQWNKETKKEHKVYMHREILNCKKVDHRDTDKLNNARKNLRTATSGQNSMNQSTQKCKKHSKYKGVSYDKSRDKWVAYCKINKKMINLGRFITEDEAAIAYNNKAEELFGEYARVNEVD